MLLKNSRTWAEPPFELNRLRPTVSGLRHQRPPEGHHDAVSLKLVTYGRSEDILAYVRKPHRCPELHHEPVGQMEHHVGGEVMLGDLGVGGNPPVAVPEGAEELKPEFYLRVVPAPFPHVVTGLCPGAGSP